MSHQLITQEELSLTIEYLNYNGPIVSEFPLDFDAEKKPGLTKVVASSAF
ncbi:MAG: hypothetical protein ACFFDC_16620 [Promethearchaeota archaeon]